MQLGIFLKRFRKEVLLSGEALSKRIGIRRYSLEKWENSGSFPNYKSALKIQAYFGIESLVNISEETLELCIARELKTLPFKDTKAAAVNTEIASNKPELSYLHSLNIRVQKLEKIAIKQMKQIQDLEKRIL